MGDLVEESRRRTTLDRLVFAEACPPPDFLKVDVEGAEWALLRGARETIGRFAPRMIVEVHAEDLEERCLGFLREHGYAARVVPRREFLPEHRPLPHNRWICAEKA